VAQRNGTTVTWIASSPDGRREQFGRFLLGTGNIGGLAATTGRGIGLSDEEGLNLIDRALAEGAKIIDTSDIYAGGNSERVVGTWRQAHPKSDALIQTKTGVTVDGPNLAPERVRQQLQRSIAVLGRVDLYLAHAVDPNTSWSDSLPVFSTAVESGYIRAYGLSNVDEAALSSALETADRLGLVRPELVQNAYSLVVRDDDRSVLPLVEAEGLAYTPYSPLANGILAGRYSKGEQPARGTRASTSPRAPGLLANPAVISQVRKFDQLAAQRKVSSAGLALAWVTRQPLLTAPIIGISNAPQWQGVHEALQIDWTAELAERINEIFPAN
jgi:aryl-alcohol dehydrogenase-like predicted oxidoreductase